MRVSIVVGALACVATAVNAAPLPAKQAAAIKAAKASLNEKLLDYPSARFQNVKLELIGDDSGFMVCGETNAKNALGGYIGWHHFYVIGSDKAAAAIIGDDVLESAVVTSCTKETPNFLPQDFSREISDQPTAKR